MFKKVKILTEEDVNRIIDARLDNFKQNEESKKITAPYEQMPHKPLFLTEAISAIERYEKKTDKVEKEIEELFKTLLKLYNRKFDIEINNEKYTVEISYDVYLYSTSYYIKLNDELYYISSILPQKGIDFTINLIEALEHRIIERTSEIRKLTREIDLKMNLDKEA